jgi:hypothetical protein
MRKVISFLAVAAAVVSVSACKDKLQQLKEDGISCARDKAMLIPQKGQPKLHCFVCNDNDSMMKCSSNPVTSGCTETPCAAQ